MELCRLIEGLGVEVARGDPRPLRVLDLTEDSRTAMPGSLFVARRGREADGREFAGDAVERGAVAVLTDEPAELDGLDACVLTAPDLPAAVARLADRFYGVPSEKLFAIGVTGTNGKTTVAHIVHRLLNAAGVRTGLIGTVEIDDGRERSPAYMTTPPAIELSRTLSVMVESGCRAVVLEASSHALDQRRVDGVGFDAGVFTNLTGDHLDYHGSMEAYAAAKRRLFELLDPETSLAIVNGDDEHAAFMASGRPTAWCHAGHDGAHPARGVSSGENDGRWRVVERGRVHDSTRVEIHPPDGVGWTEPFEARVGLVGSHNVMNTLQSVVAAHRAMTGLGLVPDESRDAIRRSLTLVGPPRGRLEPAHEERDDVSVFVDFAHTDDALRSVLRSGRTLVPAGAALWVVFGAGGDRDRSKRPRMGKVAVEGADRVVVTSDNPRTEPPDAIIGEVLSEVHRGRSSRVVVHVDRRRAIGHAVETAGPGDVIIIAGKGHETEQILPDGMGGVRTVPFDDRAEAREALARRRDSATGSHP